MIDVGERTTKFMHVNKRRKQTVHSEGHHTRCIVQIQTANGTLTDKHILYYRQLNNEFIPKILCEKTYI